MTIVSFEEWLGGLAPHDHRFIKELLGDLAHHDHRSI
jgi:hypothetical protein